MKKTEILFLSSILTGRSWKEVFRETQRHLEVYARNQLGWFRFVGFWISFLSILIHMAEKININVSLSNQIKIFRGSIRYCMGFFHFTLNFLRNPQFRESVFWKCVNFCSFQFKFSWKLTLYMNVFNSGQFLHFSLCRYDGLRMARSAWNKSLSTIRKWFFSELLAPFLSFTAFLTTYYIWIDLNRALLCDFPSFF